jgi:hypothetical protein
MHGMSNYEDANERLHREAVAFMQTLEAKAAAQAPDPVLPAGWNPMRTAPKDAVVLLHVPQRGYTQLPAVSLGYFDGLTWMLITQVDGDVRKEACDPDAWQPLPGFAR